MPVHSTRWTQVLSDAKSKATDSDTFAQQYSPQRSHQKSQDGDKYTQELWTTSVSTMDE